MPEVSLKAFDYGEITDGDPFDLTLRSAKKLLNVDIDRGVGLVKGRLGYAAYTDIDPMQDTDNAAIPAGTHVFHRFLPFQTGTTTTVNNMLIITRNPASTEFSIYSNAPQGGNGNKYNKLETVTATSCRAMVVDGIVYVTLDNDITNNHWHRVHYQLYALYNGTRNYFNSAVTITSSTTPATQNSLGAGGKIHNGMIYDWHKLYCDGSTDSVTVGNFATGPISGSITALPIGNYSLFACPVYDGDPDQYGVPSAIQEVKHTQANAYFTFDITVVNGTTFNRRLKRVDLFAKFSSEDNSVIEADYACVLQIDINSGIPSPFTAAWAVSGGGYKVSVPFDGRMYRNFTVIFWSHVSGGRPVSHAVNDISVCATMLEHTKERMFAIGTENDLGGEKIRHTSMGWGGKGCRDVWWKLNTFWKEGGYKINYIKEWRGRLYFFQHVNSYYMDVAQRQVPAPWPLDYKTDEAGYGFGTTLVNTISGCPDGIFFANFQSIFLLDGETPIDILDSKKKDEWLAITDADKALAVGRYNAYRNTFWIKVKNGSAWEIWLYNMNPKQKNWRTYYFDGKPNDEPIYFFRDNNNKFIFVSGTNLYEYEKKTGGSKITDNGAGIGLQILTQHIDLGTLTNNIIYRLKARANTLNTGTPEIIIQFRRDEQTPLTDPMKLLKYVGNASQEQDGTFIREMNLMCQSVQMNLTCDAGATATAVPAIKQIDLLYKTEPKV